MATKKSDPDYPNADPALKLRGKKAAAEAQAPLTHIYHDGAVCETDSRGYPTPDNRSPLELVVDASEGFIPLWDRDVILRWRFHEASMLLFVNPAAAKGYLRQLMGEALMLWGEAVPVRLTEAHDAWDFELAVNANPSCSPAGCTLARAFFPDAGRHDIVIYPTMFDQSRQEQIETLAHEFGHVFGLRHFFATVSETAFPVEIFGKHRRFSIMNYGPESRMTRTDRTDLAKLYQQAWSGALTHINGTPIRLVRPFSAFRLRPAAAITFAAATVPVAETAA